MDENRLRRMGTGSRRSQVLTREVGAAGWSQAASNRCGEWLRCGGADASGGGGRPGGPGPGDLGRTGSAVLFLSGYDILPSGSALRWVARFSRATVSPLLHREVCEQNCFGDHVVDLSFERLGFRPWMRNGVGTGSFA